MVFVYEYDAHRDLHSFPTRRSSDLLYGSAEYLRASSRGEASYLCVRDPAGRAVAAAACSLASARGVLPWPSEPQDRKSTRLNPSHVEISYAVFCLKKKNDRSIHLNA